MNNEQKLRNGDEVRSESDIIRGDVLESILCHVPLIHLVPVCHVSKSWNRAVFSSLRHSNKRKPWLIVHCQSSRPPHATASAFAYDPRSNLWLRINPNPPVEYVSDLRSSSSTLLYMLSISKFSFSFDPLHMIWHQTDPPTVWRTDPVVAMVGHRHIVIAGGACDFEDDPLSVEIYDLEKRKWETCEPLPITFKHSAASTWLSVAADTKKLYAMEQASGITCSFDPIARIWSGPYDLRRDPNIYFSAIGISRDNLIMVSLLGNSENVEDIRIWELKGESFEFCKEIGVVPKELVDKLTGERACLSSIKIISAYDVLYLYNPEQPGELVVCEIDDRRGIFRWGSLKNAAVNDRSRVAERVVLTCGDVRLGDLGNAMMSGKGSFSIVKDGILR
ncbi:Kelch domain-containing F-box protein [Hibiscus trionum]|uniref:Kelch domain-containing F-box protein n=1 Tax=Hibiscus trionum TaxID=183268 RepID=A0A9W7HSN1_HIBTR|nr:Kelch domain-containing F-box protein [Hibiscus trionum]